MKIFGIGTRTLAFLEAEFRGTVSDALTEVVRSRCEPELRAERFRFASDEPSRWTIVVTGDGSERRFDADRSMVATAIAAHIYAIDFAEELRSDLASSVQDQDSIDALGDKLPWPILSRGDPS